MGKYKVRPGRFAISMIISIGVLTIAIWGALAAIGLAKETVRSRMLDVKQLAWDKTVFSAEVEGIIIKSEETIKAPAQGELQLLVKDGERMRVGAPIARVKGITEQVVYSPRAGVFCTHVDGLESLLDPGLIDVLDMGAVEKIKENIPDGEAAVSGGEVLGKVVDNLKPVIVYVRAELPQTAGVPFQNGSGVVLRLDKTELQGKISKLWQEQNVYTMFIEIKENNCPDSFVHDRRQKFDLYLESLEGWLVPEQAIAFKDGVPGLYLVVKQKVVFEPVAVEGRLNGEVSVTGENLDKSVRYVSNPAWAREGVRLGG